MAVVGTRSAVALGLVAALLVAFGLYGAYVVFVTQCFSHHVPDFPNHGLSKIREASPAGLAAANAVLELHLQRGEPLVLRDGSAMHGWDANACWAPACVRRRFGDQPVDAPGHSVSGRSDESAPLSHWLDVFFDADTHGLDVRAAAGSAAECFRANTGQSHCTVDEGGAPFCSVACFANATINFGLHPNSESFLHWKDALSSTGWLALQRQRALKGDSWLAWITSTLFPSQYGFDPGMDWVEGVLWLSPKGARTGRSVCHLLAVHVPHFLGTQLNRVVYSKLSIQFGD